MIYFLLILLLAILVFIVKALPIISGYGAKTVCSGVFVAGRESHEVIEKDLFRFPLSLAKCEVDFEKRLVTATVFGFAKKKAIYRTGLGATLINGISEIELGKQHFKLSAPARINQDATSWQMGNIITNSNSPIYNPVKLGKALDIAFNDEKGFGTRAVIVLYKGELVAERYSEGFSKDTKLAGWSMTKSITSALVGILVQQNRLNLNTPVPIKSWKNDDRKHLTLTHLLHMSSGLHWWENYAAPSDATNMLYNEKSMGKFAMKKQLQYTPGAHFKYSSGTTNILSHLIREQIKQEDYLQFPYKELFYKLGMFDTVMEVDASGTFVGSSYCYGTARDWARFGLLYFNDGICNGERILPEGWVKFTATASTAKIPAKESLYGAHWRVNASRTQDANGRKYPAVPEDCFYCQGYEGQYIWVIPSRELVIVRLALEKRELDPNEFLPAVIDAFSNNV